MMTRRTAGWMAVVGVLGASGLASGARAQEAEIPLDQVPKAVMDAAKAKFPGAMIKEAAKETEGGKTTYELEMSINNRNVDASFEANGTLVAVESSLPESEVPAAASKAVKDKYPGAKVDLVESVKKGPELKREADYYEFHLTTADKKSLEVEVDAKGKILKTGAAAEEKDDDDDDKK